MTDQIVSRSMMFDRGVAAFLRGAGREDHGMNIGAPGIADWQAGFDDTAKRWYAAMQPQAQAVKVSPP